MSYRKRTGRGRARDASAELAFEQALLGEEKSQRKVFDPRSDRKTLQLCQQVRRALMLALAAESDETLRDVYVESVEPMGGSGQLLVRVAVSPTAIALSWDVLARLNERAPRLRAIVAQSICRKRTPTLSFIALPRQPDLREEARP